MRDWNDGHMDDGWGIAMVLGMLGIWVVLIAAVVFAIAWTVRTTRTSQAGWRVPPAAAAPGTGSVTGGGTKGATGSAEQILAERLARGDIDPEDYRARLDALRSRSEP